MSPGRPRRHAQQQHLTAGKRRVRLVRGFRGGVFLVTPEDAEAARPRALVQVNLESKPGQGTVVGAKQDERHVRGIDVDLLAARLPMSGGSAVSVLEADKSRRQQSRPSRFVKTSRGS